MVRDILDIVEDEFGVFGYSFAGKTYIMPDGLFLDIPRKEEHSIVEKFLIDSGYSDYYYVKKAGSPTLFDLGCIRCSTDQEYMYLTKKHPTEEQYKSLLEWLEFADDFNVPKIEMCAPNGARARWFFSEMSAYDMVEKIRDFYMMGQLYRAGTKR